MTTPDTELADNLDCVEQALTAPWEPAFVFGTTGSEALQRVRAEVDRLRAELSGAVADRDRADRQIRVHLDIARAAERDRDGAREVARGWEATAAQRYLRLVEYRDERDALAAKLDAVREIEPTLRRIVGNGTRSEIELIDAVEVLVSQALDAAPETTRAPAEAAPAAPGAREATPGQPEPENGSQTADDVPDVDGWTIAPHPDGVAVYDTTDHPALSDMTIPLGAVLAFIGWLAWLLFYEGRK